MKYLYFNGSFKDSDLFVWLDIEVNPVFKNFRLILRYD